jgi:hypothetical protein
LISETKIFPKLPLFASAFAHCQKNVLPEVKETLRKAEETKSDMVAARKEHLKSLVAALE